MKLLSISILFQPLVLYCVICSSDLVSALRARTQELSDLVDATKDQEQVERLVKRSRKRLRKLLKKAKVVGNNGKGGVFPLKECQGDCDNDKECYGELVCFQREKGQAVPGCSSGEKVKSRADFCVKKSALNSDNNGADDQVDDNDKNVDSAAGGYNNRETFALKLYWEQHYFWQEETIHRRWCMRCRNGCQPKNSVAIFPCHQSPTQWTFLEYANGDEIQIQTVDIQHKSSLVAVCLEVNSAENIVYLATCNSSKVDQRFVAFAGNFQNAKRFEISPRVKLGWCLTQRHHPRNNEEIKLEPCSTARRSFTSFWNKEE